MPRFLRPKAALALLLAALSLAVAGPAAAQRAIEGATPHPSVPAPQGSYITRDDFVDFAEIDFPTGPLVRGEDQPVLTVAGAHTRQEFTIDGTEIAPLRLYQSYLQYFEGEGFEILFSGIGEDLAQGRSVNFLTGSIFATQPGTASEAVYILAQRPDGSEVIALSVFDRQRARRIMVNVVDVQEMETLDLFGAPVAAEAPEETLEEEVAALPAQTGEELQTGLVSDGRVVVNAILFAFDSDEVLPDSARALETVAGLMTDNPGLRLLVVGHTDGVGSFDYNLRLSLDRASSVVSWLSERHGIAADRLRPAGAGPMSPITTNRTEQGRALNRRVELVEMID